MRLKYDDNSHAYYLDGKRCRSVTAVAKLADDTYALDQWRKRQVALGMALSPQLVERAAAHWDDKDQLNRIAEEAMQIAKSHEAAEKGTAAHRIAQRIDLEEMIVETPMAANVRKLWAKALDEADLDIDPDYVERVVVFPEHRICGRIDRFAKRRSDGRYQIVDLKTGASALRYPHAIAIQLGMYANAPLLAAQLPASGGSTATFEELPPHLDKLLGCVIHMPDDETAKPAWIDIAAGWNAFQKVVVPILQWRAYDGLIKKPKTPEQMRRDRLDTERVINDWLKSRPSLHGRIKAMPPEAKVTLARLWPEGVLTFKQADQNIYEHTADEYAQIQAAVERAEREHQLPFPEIPEHVWAMAGGIATVKEVFPEAVLQEAS